MSRSPISDRRITVYLSDDDIGQQMLDVIMSTPDYQKSKMMRQWLRDGMMANGVLTIGGSPARQSKTPRDETTPLKPQRTRRQIKKRAQPSEQTLEPTPAIQPAVTTNDQPSTETKPVIPAVKPATPNPPSSNANDPYMGLWNM